MLESHAASSPRTAPGCTSGATPVTAAVSLAVTSRRTVLRERFVSWLITCVSAETINILHSGPYIIKYLTRNN